MVSEKRPPLAGGFGSRTPAEQVSLEPPSLLTFKMKVLPWKGTSMVYTVSPYSCGKDRG